MLLLSVLLVAAAVVGSSAQSYCQICSDHTMCKYQGIAASCGQYFSGTVSGSDSNLIVNLHNSLRQRVASGQETRGNPGPQPTAVSMPNMVWDTELATVAQRWVDQCSFGHDSCRNVARFVVGQNAYQTGSSGNSANVDWTSAINAWYNEVAQFNSSTVNSFGNTPAGHYTQVVWAKSTTIGCGYAFYRPTGSAWYTKYYVCNYGPAGNWLGQPIY